MLPPLFPNSSPSLTSARITTLCSPFLLILFLVFLMLRSSTKKSMSWLKIPRLTMSPKLFSVPTPSLNPYNPSLTNVVLSLTYTSPPSPSLTSRVALLTLNLWSTISRPSEMTTRKRTTLRSLTMPLKLSRPFKTLLLSANPIKPFKPVLISWPALMMLRVSTLMLISSLLNPRTRLPLTKSLFWLTLPSNPFNPWSMLVVLRLIYTSPPLPSPTSMVALLMLLA